MMMIQGSTTEHAVVASTITGVPTNFVFEYVTGQRFQPNTASETFLDNTTTGPWRISSVTAVAFRVGGGSTPAQGSFNAAVLPHIYFNTENNLIVSGFNVGALQSGDTVTVAATATMIVHRSNGLTLFPADRCTWQTEDLSGSEGYAVNNARFFPGNAGSVSILSPQLGYIGKSGRFVKIAD